MTCVLKQNKFECRVSSILNRDARSFGKKHMFDDCNDTCWNSDSGTPQWILIDFEKECDVSRIEIEFQGGFVGKECFIEAGSNAKCLKYLQTFFPEDTNCIQQFQLSQTTKAKTFKLVFQESTDLFVLYCHKLQRSMTSVTTFEPLTSID